jgi:hypothetical protein
MPRPVFDIEQYELRGAKPDVFTPQQYKELNRSIGRAHGQIDWTAQLLGYNGPNYWGTSGYKSDGTFTWNGLPETMVEKRQMQATTYGIYAKDKSYESWPAPFNRSEILASGDLSFHMYEKGGRTLVAPFGIGEETDLSYDPTIFVGAAYIFDGEIEFYNPHLTDDLIKTETFSEGDLLWTRLYVLDVVVDDIGIRRKGSEAEFFYLSVSRWKDISDWNVNSISSQFLGVWGNKGASVSLDAQFDALHLHGFDERKHLENLGNSTEVYTLDELFASIGAKPTPWSAFYNLNLAFRINGSEIFYPEPQEEFESRDFFEYEDCDVIVNCRQLIEEDIPSTVDCCEVDNVLYDRLNGAYLGPSVANSGEYDIFDPLIPEYCVNAIDAGWTLSGAPSEEDTEFCSTMEGDVNDTRPKGIGSFVFEVEAKNDCAIENLCLEWIFDSELDSGSYDSIYAFPGVELPVANCCEADNEETPPPYLGPNLADGSDYKGELVDGDPVACEKALVGGDYPETYTCDPADPSSEMESDQMPVFGPWITFDEGEYDNSPYPNDNMGTESLCLNDGGYNFDDGIYDEPREPECDVPESCPVIDGDEIWTYAYFPDYDDCVCDTECCLIDNFPYLDTLAYQGPDIVDGGERIINCCITDNGIMGNGPFEGDFNVAPIYTDCGPDGGVNPWYCCEALDNETYEFGVSPYYGPNHVDNCQMQSRLVRVEQQFDSLQDVLAGLKRDFDWPPELTDNGVLGLDEYSIDNEDPDCLPYYCHLDNSKYGTQKYDYTVDDCTMIQSNSIEECDDPDPPRPPIKIPNKEDLFAPVYETYIVDCKSCWDECSTCEDLGDLCPIDTVYVKIPLLQKEVLYRMHPGLENAFTPLRLWKPPTLNVTDDVRNHDTDRYNFLIADDNRGANPEDAYRSFVRLPLEYARNGREWTKARTVCDNMTYWSSTNSSVEVKWVEESDAKQLLYEECIDKDLPQESIIYFEDYIHSSWTPDESESGLLDGFDEGEITFEPTSKGAFTTFTVVNYNALELRQPDRDGEWRGNYYRFTSKKETRLSGHVSQDLTSYVLEEVSKLESPIHDMSEVKHLKSYFPDEEDRLTMKNFVVSYAYFAADYSAGDEPVFDPTQDYCHRDPVRTCSTVDRNGECIPTTYRNKSNYLLHPTV